MGETGKPDVDDISLDDPRVPKKSGTSAVLGLVVLIVIAGVVLFMVKAQRDKIEAHNKAVADAAQSRAAALSLINDQITQALTDAQSGNLDSAVAKLDAVEAKLGLIISEANGVGDQDAANQAMTKRQAVIDAKKGLEEIRTSIAEKLAPLATAFGVTAPAATTPAPTTEAAPATDGTTAPTTPTDSAAPAASPAPTTPEAAPAAPQAAPAPVAAPAPAPTAPAAS